MMLDHDKANERLNSNRNLVNRFGKNRVEHTRFMGPTKSPEVNRPFIKDTALSLVKMGHTHKEVAEKLGIEVSAVTSLASNKPSKGLDATEAIEQVRDAALDKLMQAMGLIDEEKLAKLGAKDLSHVAANMSKVVERTLPKEQNNSGITFVVYSPQVKAEKDFKVVEI